ncbi:hypothetical protein SKAU_G00125310 [Synaphobranchus kaupii]|uniref:Uncharacterized protein n=1 Tax=Synaphobranchus kaupii TaxID=118154 RepID=A0A9Q1FPC3_SYNKA|nr:hypothetical protein SKAU_G00125310 [Synaphobranchus kaupii]
MEALVVPLCLGWNEVPTSSPRRAEREPGPPDFCQNRASPGSRQTRRRRCRHGYETNRKNTAANGLFQCQHAGFISPLRPVKGLHRARLYNGWFAPRYPDTVMSASALAVRRSRIATSLPIINRGVERRAVQAEDEERTRVFGGSLHRRRRPLRCRSEGDASSRGKDADESG